MRLRPTHSSLQPILTDTRLRAASAQLNTTSSEVMAAAAEEDKRIEHVRVDIELKSLVNRIKGMTSQMKGRVKKQKEISETIISERDDLDQEGETTTINIDQINQQININTSQNDVSIILPQRPKSGNMLSRVTRHHGLLSQGNYNTVNVELENSHKNLD